MKGYRSVSETAKKWGVSIRWVNQYILEGRVPGCERLGRSWAVPEDAVKPERQKPAIKNGKEKKNPRERLIFLNDG
ncbi:MAG: DNA-binding protein [Clostridia bacterium]|nr:DNA-binding protein [Clostridia bacterium]MBR6186074.1 DNA-binding protein [Clostridia bacterium]